MNQPTSKMWFGGRSRQWGGTLRAKVGRINMICLGRGVSEGFVSREMTNNTTTPGKWYPRDTYLPAS